MRIKNNVKDTQLLNWNRLKEYKCNTLKTNREIDNLVNSIKSKGFIAPLFIYEEQEYIIDGAGRIQALIELENQGYEIDEIPIVYLNAKNLKEAKEIVTLISSSYGKVDQFSFAEFLIDFKITEIAEIKALSSFVFPEIKPIEFKETEPKVIKDDLNLVIKFETIEQKQETIAKLDEMKTEGGFDNYAQLLYKYF